MWFVVLRFISMLVCENVKKMSVSSVINCRAIFYTFGNSGRNYIVFRVAVSDDKQKDVKKFKSFIRLVLSLEFW